MEEQKINFETAKLAKEKGFDWDVTEGFTKDGAIFVCGKKSGFFSKECRRPTQSLLQKWLRDVHKIEINIEPGWENSKKEVVEYIPWVYYRVSEEHLPDEEAIYLKVYEEALEIALVEALELIKDKKKFYRVCNTETLRGLWYDFKGDFTGIIHEDFKFCLNSSLKMDFDSELVGWLSATDSLEDLYKWFTKEDILKLQEFGWYIHEFEAENYKFYERFQHIIIEQDTSKVIKKIEL